MGLAVYGAAVISYYTWHLTGLFHFEDVFDIQPGEGGEHWVQSPQHGGGFVPWIHLFRLHTRIISTHSPHCQSKANKAWLRARWQTMTWQLVSPLLGLFVFCFFLSCITAIVQYVLIWANACPTEISRAAGEVVTPSYRSRDFWTRERCCSREPSSLTKYYGNVVMKTANLEGNHW